jgi:hypothetical protein
MKNYMKKYIVTIHVETIHEIEVEAETQALAEQFGENDFVNGDGREIISEIVKVNAVQKA